MRNKKARVSVDVENLTLNWKWDDGLIDVVRLHDFPTAIVEHLALHGLKAKLGDTYAGEPILSTSKRLWAQCRDQLMGGTWSAGRARTSILARAIARMRGLDVEDAVEVLAALDKDTLKKLRKNKRVRMTIAKIELEDAEAGVSDDDEDDDVIVGILSDSIQ
jgi:uncharacterized sporulation protein YeaH/YhbH (DUF444 family)